jgi:acyl carrier protein/NAD(P)-dependent dehydrogenase (short-subunit alcohol dehydrogenase family)
VLEIMADKTGYDVDMLETDMNMEADLGIDSIKRVEILGQVQETLNVTVTDMDALSQTETVQDVIDFMNKLMGAVGSTSKNESPNKSQEILYDNHKKSQLMTLSVAKLVKLDNPSLIKDKTYDIQTNSDKLGSFKKYNGTETEVYVHMWDSLHKSFTIAKNMFQKTKMFIGVTRMDGYLGFKPSGYDLEKCEQGSMCGLLKTLNLEWPSVTCKMIDIAPDISDSEMVKIIESEIQSSDRSTVEVGYAMETGQLIRHTITPHSLISSSHTATLESDDVLLVAGGARGICADILKAMLKRAKKNTTIHLMARSNVNPIPEWAQNIPIDNIQSVATAELKKKGKVKLSELKKLVANIQASREINENIKQMQDLGANVSYVSCDVTDKSKIRETIKKIGKITGVIFASGVLRDQLIQKKKMEDLDLVYNTKVRGVRNILESLDAPLRHLVVFSSAAGIFGNIGQSDYSAANDVLNKIAHTYKTAHPAANVCAWAFGPVDSPGGMIAKNPRIRENFENMGVEIVPLHSGGAELIADMFYRADATQVIYGNWLAPSRPSDTSEMTIEHHFENSTLDDHTINGKQVVPMAYIGSYVVDLLMGLYPGKSVKEIQNLRVFKPLQNDTIIRVKIQHFSDVVSVKVFKLDSSKKAVPCYELKAVLCEKLETMSLSPKSSDHMNVYEKYNSLFHGKKFQILDGASVSDSETVCELNTPDVNNKIDALAWDGAYQTMLIHTQEKTGKKSVPMECKKIEIFKSSCEKKFVQFQETKQSKTQVTGDVMMCDGSYVLRMSDCSVSMY